MRLGYMEFEEWYPRRNCNRQYLLCTNLN